MHCFASRKLAALLTCALAFTSAASADVIQLHKTGESGGVDPNYILNGGVANVIATNLPGVYVSPGASGARWIGPDTNGTNTHAGADFSFTTTFDLTGLDPATASLAGFFSADNFAHIFLNGHDTGKETTGATQSTGREHFRQLTAFSITNSSWFQSGGNTIEFRVTNDSLNGGGSYNPTALLVTDLTLTATKAHAPEPASLVLWGTLVCVGVLARRRRPLAS